MTDEERYIRQGRARDEARKLKADIATLQVFFRDYIEALDNLKSEIVRFLSDPTLKCADGRLGIDRVNALRNKMTDLGVSFLESTDELFRYTKKLCELEEQIKDF